MKTTPEYKQIRNHPLQPLSLKQELLALVRHVCLLNNLEEGIDLIAGRLAASTSPVILSFINAHAYNLSVADQSFRQHLLESDVLLRDGKGMEILYKSLKTVPGVNFNGTDFIPMLLNRWKDKKVALLGTRDPYLETAATQLRESGIDIVLVKNGFLAVEDYLAAIWQLQPDIILLGMGMPKQEGVAHYLKTHLDFPCLIINGGAVIDFIGKKVSRAPKWMRDNGMEWCYRLALEPRRLFKRYVKGNFIFLKQVVRLRMTFNQQKQPVNTF